MDLTSFTKPEYTLENIEISFRAKSLLTLYIIYIFICLGGILFSEDIVRYALLIGTPVLITGYFVTKKISYKIGGSLAIAGTALITAIIVLRFDSAGHFSYLALSWITISIFIASIIFSFREVVIITLLQILFSVILSLSASTISLKIFISWFFLNLFFISINLAYRWIIDRYHQMINENKVDLEFQVREKTKELSESVKQKEVLLQELFHRTRNNMQVMASLLRLQSDGTSDENIRKALTDARSRIQTMALVHDRLFQSSDLWIVSLKDYLTDMISGINELYIVQDYEVLYDIRIEDIKVPFEDILPMGLIVYELI